MTKRQLRQIAEDAAEEIIDRFFGCISEDLQMIIDEDDEIHLSEDEYSDMYTYFDTAIDEKLRSIIK